MCNTHFAHELTIIQLDNLYLDIQDMAIIVFWYDTEQIQDQTRESQRIKCMNGRRWIVDCGNLLRKQENVWGGQHPDLIVTTWILGTRSGAGSAKDVLEEQHIDMFSPTNKLVADAIEN